MYQLETASLTVPAGMLIPIYVQQNIAYLTPLAHGGTISTVRLSDGAVLWKHTLDQMSTLTPRVIVAP